MHLAEKFLLLIFHENYFDLQKVLSFKYIFCIQLNTPTSTLTITAPPSRRYDTLMLTKGQLNIKQGAAALVNLRSSSLYILLLLFSINFVLRCITHWQFSRINETL